jgi:hypothetical protein
MLTSLKPRPVFQQRRHAQALVACRTCLAETDIDKLEDLWRELDERWMQIKHWIDIVPDIEYGKWLFAKLVLSKYNITYAD